MHRIPATSEQAEFLLAIIRPPSDASATQRLSRLAAGVEDWTSILQMAGEHGLLPILFWRFPEFHAYLDSDRLRSVSAECLGNTARNIELASELLCVLRALDAAGMPALPFKGVALAASLYGDLRFRRAGDLDILIRRADLDRAAEIMRERGYALITPLDEDGIPVDRDTCEYQFLREPDGIVVELRWRLAPFAFRKDLDMDILWPRRRRATLLGAEIPDIGSEDLLILLCMHGTKHQWLRLFWVCDIVRLIDSNPALDWDEVERTARRFGLWRTLGLGVLLSHRLGGAPLSSPVLRRLLKDGVLGRLEEHIGAHFFDASRPPFPGLPFEAQTLEFGDRIRNLGRAALQTPNSQDRAVIQIPPALDFLYYFVRPFRLAWVYRRRAR